MLDVNVDLVTGQARDAELVFALSEPARRELSAVVLPADGRVRLGIRPEHVKLVEQGGIAGTLYGAEHHGAEIIAIIQAGSHMLRATIPANSRVTVNQPLQFSFMQDKLHYFHPLTGDNLKH